MLFHSQIFILVFLPLILLMYYTFSVHVAIREWAIIAASAVFYAWWDWRFLPLLVCQVTAGWLVAEALARTGRRWLMPVGVTVNLCVLATFKYLDFFAGVLGSILGRELPSSGIILPIGISFFTFQIISYLVDLHRGTAPFYSFRRFTLVIMLFPHLIAGPIVRHVELVPQFDLDPLRSGLAERLSNGIALFVIALAVKVMVADRLAPHIDRIFSEAGQGPVSQLLAWTGAIGFSLQIFLDFAAYSEMAMGLAVMLGLAFPMNFACPYRATSLRDFWRRWHMSLSRFLRDYVYVPLGGSRNGFARFAFATMGTMGLCGLWHGAGWPFVLWGLLHGAGLVVCRAWRERGPVLPDAIGWLLTVSFVVSTFVPFRAPDMVTAVSMLAGMAGLTGLGSAPETGLLMLIGVSATLSMLPKPTPALVADYLKPNPIFAALIALAAFYSIAEVGRGQPLSFIYFQF